MTRRGRAISFLVAACFCAAVAASLASGYGARVERRYGALRPVVVASADLRPGKVLGQSAAERLEIRRVPARFVPPGAISSISDAVGRAPAAILPRGSYLLAAQLATPKDNAAGPELGVGRSPVEIAVAGAAALGAAGGSPTGTRVDVVVTTEPKGGGAGRTYIAARQVELLDLRSGADSAPQSDAAAAVEGAWTATLALTRDEALKLIAAESFARQIRLLAEPGPVRRP